MSSRVSNKMYVNFFVSNYQSFKFSNRPKTHFSAPNFTNLSSPFIWGDLISPKAPGNTLPPKIVVRFAPESQSLCQGGGEAPKNLSGRLVAATWWLFGFIIIASYTANLAAFLTVSRLDTPIESLDGLSKQYKIQYAPLDKSATMTYFYRMSKIETKFYE